MTTILFELGTEELPPKNLKTLRDALKHSVQTLLNDQNIGFDDIRAFAAPRRLALIITGVGEFQPDRIETKKGPSVKAAFDESGQLTRAGQGFLQGLNAAGRNLSAEDLGRIADKKGEYIAYDLTIKGEKITDLMPTILQKSLDDLPIAKRMRSGNDRHEFVRPVQWVVLMSDDAVIEATIQGHKTGNQSRGHRYHSPDFFVIDHADHYENLLKNHQVIADFDQRQADILAQVKTLADEVNGAAIIPQELLDEVTALVDLPVSLRASFEERFLSVPQEALISTMQADQKYFCLTDQAGKLMPHFIFISNINSKDPAEVIAGNEKVVRPRLSDAEFFFLQDQKQPLFELSNHLKTQVFQDKLGTLWEKSERVANLAAFIANQMDADTDAAHRAGLLSKCDLASTLVGEFPELQGVAGTYYARLNQEPDAVADAIEEQYLPKFSGDQLPATDVGTALALADRLDTLVGIFGIGEIPSGSKDPFSLRRASIGILRILIEKRLHLSLPDLVKKALMGYGDKLENVDETLTEVMAFINARYRAMYSEQGVAVDTIQAVQAVQTDVPMDFDERIQAVTAFRALPQAGILAENNKRVANILAKADTVQGAVDPQNLIEPAEQALYEAIESAKASVQPLNDDGDYQGVLTTLVSLSEPLTQFFDHVMVNADDETLKRNRLVLLNQVRGLFLSVADIGLLQQ
ncbi:glycine--tRNA ligase subunit beta [Moraxella catarrhalis]|uniref:Glycine--tRNA ligase beta subunit n=1 Tax=Moraxella catarrhalis TaxID=480 RepID=A0A198UNR4_MORCA|nr:glycine--tRNA ligase subunit beta [Moraxella catarrhalis]OAU95923.1 Glycyl-tRNA synthetase beta chain [Moraxella catarrhalis]OAU97996.1 Glycyl-tRNA synthetase beta chain [Moraxella catarrhalis]OAU98915.1 Glycyl-tRNA synthetase beta chain [Moraxella catarrhalis]